MVAGIVSLLACTASALHYIETPPLPTVMPPTSNVPARAISQALNAAMASAQGDAAGTEESIRLALLHDPNSASLWLQLAQRRAESGDPVGQRAALQEAVRLGPSLPQTWAARAIATPDQKAAIEDARKSLALGESYEGYAALCPLQPDADCVRRWSRFPAPTPAAAQKRGLLRAQVGDSSGAFEDLRLALEAAGPYQQQLSAGIFPFLLENPGGPMTQTVCATFGRVTTESGRAEEAAKTLNHLEARWGEVCGNP